MAKKVFSDFVTNIPEICNNIGANLINFQHNNKKISGQIVHGEDKVVPFEIYSIPGADDKCDIKMTIKGEDYYGPCLDVDRAHEILEKFTVSLDPHDAIEMGTAEDLKEEEGYDVTKCFGQSYANIETIDGTVYHLDGNNEECKII